MYMYIHVHFNYRATEIIFNIPELFNYINFLNSNDIIKNCSIRYSDIIEQIWTQKNPNKTNLKYKKQIGRNHLTLHNHDSLALPPKPPDPGAMELHYFGRDTLLLLHSYALDSADINPGTEEKIFKEWLHLFRTPP